MPQKSPKPPPPEYCPKSFLIEVRGLPALLNRADSRETPDSIRQLIAVSAADECSLREQFGADAERFKKNRENIVTEFNALVKRRQRT